MGIGSRLHEAVIELMRSEGRPECRLWVLQENHPAREFYERRVENRWANAYVAVPAESTISRIHVGTERMNLGATDRGSLMLQFERTRRGKRGCPDHVRSRAP
jgi:ribosomal protein S18 acetylase RimI-like enzyme